MAATTYTGTRNGDRLSARTSGDTLEGLGGNDILSSGTTALSGVKLFGGDGNDTLIAKDGDALIDGGLGIDTVQFNAAVTTGLLDNELVGVENVVITNIVDAEYDFSAQTEKLNISGGKAGDSIQGGLGADTLSGGAGNDLLVAQDTDALIDGGAGIDTVSFAGAVSAADLTDKDLVGVEKVEITDSDPAMYDFSVQSEGLVIMGVDADDTIIGGKGADTVQFDANVSGLTDLELKNVEKVEIVDINLDGYGIRLDLWLQTESLQISGAGENDTILGGYRADTITGGAGADALYGNDGADLFVADASDLIDGGLGDDTVRYATGFEAFADGNLVNVERVVITNSGNAAYDFSDQSEKLNISGGAGSDTLHGGSGADTLSGGSGNDLIIAVDTDGLLDGGAGTDTVRFAAAVSAANLADQDLVAIEKVEIAGTGAAAYDFSAQSEGLNITGSASVDSVTGGKGADSISGGVGDDSLDGSAGNDTLFGGVGDDTLVGGAGADILRGGDGADLLVAEDTDGLIDGGANAVTGVTVERDKVKFAKGVSAKNLLNADMVGIEDVEITNTSTDATYDFSAQTEALVIKGNSRNDVIIGSQDWDSITGGAGNDTLRGGKGRDDFLVDAGNDTIADLEVRERLGIAAGATATATGVLDYRLIDVWGPGVLNIVGTPKVDAIWGSNIRDSITALEGNDTIDARDGNDTVLAGAGNDSVLGGLGEDSLDGGLGNDTLDGGDDNDKITAGAGNDSVLGGKGDDSLDGGEGNDTIDGGEGNDTVTAGTGNDSIRGDLGNDSLDGGEGNDTIDGGAGDDILIGGAGVDSLIGGNGIDVFKIVALSDINGLAETIDGGTDGSVDRIDLGASGSVNLSLARISNVETLNFHSGGNTVEVAAAQVGTGVSQINTINGGAGADTLRTADAIFNLVGVGLSGIETVGTTAMPSATIIMDAADIGTTVGKVNKVSSSNPSGFAELQTPDATLDLTGVTLENIDKVSSTATGPTRTTITIDDADLGASGVSIIGTADMDGTDVLATNDNTLDVSDVTLLNVDTLTVDADKNATGPLTIKVLGSQVSGSDPTKVSTIGSPNLTQTLTLRMAAPGYLDLTDVNLNNVDSIEGTTGRDTIKGSNADDTIVGGPGSDSLDGGLGSNTLTYADITTTAPYPNVSFLSGVAINLSGSGISTAVVKLEMTGATLGGNANPTQDGPELAVRSSGYLVVQNYNNNRTNSGLADRDSLAKFVRVEGSALADYIVGDTVAETISGGAGDDVVYGGAGVDTSDFKVTARPAAVALGALTMAGRNNQDVMAR